MRIAFTNGENLAGARPRNAKFLLKKKKAEKGMENRFTYPNLDRLDFSAKETFSHPEAVSTRKAERVLPAENRRNLKLAFSPDTNPGKPCSRQELPLVVPCERLALETRELRHDRR